MIARLRARHRRAWLALTLVLPAVLVAAWAGRRTSGPASPVALPSGWRDLRAVSVHAGLRVLGAADGAGRQPGEAVTWTWLRDEAAGTWWLELLPEATSRDLEPLLYGTTDPQGQLRDLLGAWEGGSSGRGLADLALPADAVLLGRWPHAGGRAYEVPVELAERGGYVLTWDLRASRIDGVGRLPRAGVPP